jgi:hypothetical protein
VSVTQNRALNFYHLVYRDVVLETAEEVQAWGRDLGSRIVEGGRVDLIINLGGLTVKPAFLKLYDDIRQDLIARRVRRVYRYGGTPAVRTKLITSATLHGQAPNVFATYEEALRALEADRGQDLAGNR